MRISVATFHGPRRTLASRVGRESLSLTLLVTGVRADDLHATVTPDHPALLTDSLNACSDLHVVLSGVPATRSVLLVAVGDPTPLEVVRGELHLDAVTREYPDVVHPHLAGDVGQNVVAILQLDPEHGVGQGFHFICAPESACQTR